MKAPELETVDDRFPHVNALALPAGAADESAREGATDGLAVESPLGVPALVDDVSFAISDTGLPLVTLGEGRDGNGLDADGVGTRIAFYGVKASGRRFVFVTDCSSSMNGPPIERLKRQLRETIGGLPPQAEFSIVFFNSGPIPMPSAGLAKAAPASKRTSLQWADQVPSEGGTDPSQALAIALKLRPSVVFLLTDGFFDPEPTFTVINRLNNSRTTRITPIAIVDRGAESVLQQIAEENRGVYTFVPDRQRSGGRESVLPVDGCSGNSSGRPAFRRARRPRLGRRTHARVRRRRRRYSCPRTCVLPATCSGS